MHFAVESWNPEYGSPIEGGQPNDAAASVDPNIEVPLAEWAPVSPGATAKSLDEVLFIDGVRRIDARVWVTDDRGQTTLGICATYAAGAVRCNSHATIEAHEVRRSLFSVAGAQDIVTRSATYSAKTVATDSMDDLISAVQSRMGDLEKQIARAAEPSDLLVIDGPLRLNIKGAMGYIKTHQARYLPQAGDDTVAKLEAGQRTPLFVTQQHGFSRFSWYLRLPYGDGHPWAGVVRCETSADIPLDQARSTADAATIALPRFASQPHKDPRAPQNLYPIGGLERELRRRLGDPQLLYRSLRAAAAKATAPVA